MLHGGPADPHGAGVAIQAHLHGLEHRLVLPSAHPPHRTCRALGLQAAGSARPGPVFVHQQSCFFRGEAPGQPLAGGTAVDVLLGQIDEVLLAEATLGLGVGCQGLWNVGLHPERLAGQDLLAVEVAAVGQHLEPLHA